MAPVVGQVYTNRSGGKYRCLARRTSAGMVYFNPLGGSSSTEGVFQNIKPVRYFSIRRPIGPGTFPKSQPVRQIVNYDRREYVIAIEQEAWGYIDFGGELDEEEAYRYELVREQD